MKIIKNKVISVKTFSLLLLFVFFVGLQSPVYAEITTQPLLEPIVNVWNGSAKHTELRDAIVTAIASRNDRTNTVALKKSVAEGEYIEVKKTIENHTPRRGAVKYLSDWEASVLSSASTDSVKLIWNVNDAEKTVPSAVPSGKYIYILHSGRLYLHEDIHAFPKFGHPAFLSEGKSVSITTRTPFTVKAAMTVQGAGEIVIGNDGVVTNISNKSGHYQPTQEEMMTVLAWLVTHMAGATTTDKVTSFLSHVQVDILLQANQTLSFKNRS